MTLDRARGALIGLAVGDALGAPTEGMTRTAIRDRFGWVTDLEDGAAGTDDTEYAVLTARTVLARGAQMTSEDVARTWLSAVAAQDSGFYGAGFSEMMAIANLRDGILPPASGTHSYERWSDGAAMRVAPLAVFARGDADEAARLARIDARVSHSGDGIFCAEAIAAAVATALVSTDHRPVLDAAVAALPVDSWSARLAREAIGIGAASASAAEAIDELYEQISVFEYPWADAAPEATALTLGIFAAARGDFTDAVLASVNIGRDSDTIAAMNGALSGALCGYDAIPEHWRTSVRHVMGRCIADTAGTDLLDLADRLFAARSTPVPEEEIARV